MRAFLFILVSVMPGIASAHIGHIGEVAGHTHWIAVGAGLAVAGIGAWLGKKKLDAEARGEKAGGEEAEGEAEKGGEGKEPEPQAA